MGFCGNLFLSEHFFFLSRFGLWWSLTSTLSGGISWWELEDVLLDVHVIYGLMFPVFISVMVLVCLNVITGIFVNDALEMAQRDREMVQRWGLWQFFWKGFVSHHVSQRHEDRHALCVHRCCWPRHVRFPARVAGASGHNHSGNADPRTQCASTTSKMHASTRRPNQFLQIVVAFARSTCREGLTTKPGTEQTESP